MLGWHRQAHPSLVRCGRQARAHARAPGCDRDRALLRTAALAIPALAARAPSLAPSFAARSRGLAVAHLARAPLARAPLTLDTRGLAYEG